MSLTVFFEKLPPPTFYLLLAALFPCPSAHVLPRQTTTLAHRTLAVEPWPPLPTAPPPLPFLLPRQQPPNTVCGFIDADPSLPVTCASGSHCVVDRGAGAIGCCPDGPGACTTGVFTGCRDAASSRKLTQVDDPYIFTCSGADVCYTNAFEGGLTQVGCGSATSLAASVATTAASTALSFETVDLRITGRESSTSSLRGGTATATATASGDGSDTPADEMDESGEEAGAPEDDGIGGQTGAIVGGTLGGIAVLVALVALGYFLWRRRARNARAAPRTSNAKHIRPVSNESAESGFPPHPTPGRPAPANAPGLGGPAGEGADAAQVPLTRGEFGDFHRGFSEALGNIREEDEGGMGLKGARAGTVQDGSGGTADVAGVGAPLWQQNRRQSRNMMWM